MRTRLGSRLVIWTLVAGCGAAIMGTWVGAAQDVNTQAVAAAPEAPTPTPVPVADASVDRQMLAFEHHAQVNMILYAGRFGQSDRAVTSRQLPSIALILKTGGK